MSQIQMKPNVDNVKLQQVENVKADLKPREDLPQELQNARPSKSGILPRIGAFVLGAGAAGGATFGLGGGALLSGAIGASATAALGGATVVTALATGGAAIIGGAIVLGLYAGVKAIVSHCRRAPDPEPRIVNQTQNRLPKNKAVQDAFNKRISDAITSGMPLNGSLQAALDRVAERYGKKEAMIGDVTVQDLIGEERLEKFAREVRNLDGDVDAAKLEQLLEKYMNGNMDLHDNMRKLNLPQEHMDALNEFLVELGQSFGDCAPRDRETLRGVYPIDMRLDAFVIAMEKKVAESDVKVTPEILKRMAKEVIAPEMAVRGIASVLTQEAAKSGLVLSPKAARMAAVEIYNAQGRPAIASLDEARAFVDAHNDLASPSVQKAALLEGLKNVENMPPAYKAALEEAVNGLRLAFGTKCLPGELGDILETDVAQGTSLKNRLDEMLKNGPVSPEDFGRACTDLLKRAAQDYAMASALGQAVEKSHGVSLTPAGSEALLNGLRKSMPGLKAQIRGLNGAADAAKIAAGPALQPFLTEIAENVKSAEETYLPQVSDAAKPLLQNIIRSLPFDAASRSASFALIDRTAKDMANWKARIDFGEPALKTFCDKMAAELMLFTADPHYAGKFTDGIFSGFRADARRNEWTVNGKELNFMHESHLIGETKKLLPDTVDLKFVTQLANQYTWTALMQPLMGAWRDSGDASAGHVAGTGLTTYTAPVNTEGLLRQDAKIDSPKANPGWIISVSPDKKTAVIEMIRPFFVCADDRTGAPAGSIMHRMRIHCSLSAGSSDGKPKVLNVEVSQEIKAYEF